MAFVVVGRAMCGVERLELEGWQGIRYITLAFFCVFSRDASRANSIVRFYEGSFQTGALLRVGLSVRSEFGRLVRSSVCVARDWRWKANEKKQRLSRASFGMEGCRKKEERKGKKLKVIAVRLILNPSQPALRYDPGVIISSSTRST